MKLYSLLGPKLSENNERNNGYLDLIRAFWAVTFQHMFVLDADVYIAEGKEPFVHIRSN